MSEVCLAQDVPTKALCKFSQVSCNRVGFSKVHSSRARQPVKKRTSIDNYKISAQYCNKTMLV